MPRVSPVVAAAALATCLASCGVTEEPDPPLYPLISSASDRVRSEFGPGSLQTTSNARWGGAGSVIYPTVVDSDEGPVDLEIHGLDLSRIEYKGDMGWPPDESDAGAMIRVSLHGSSEISYRVWSSVADFLELAGDEEVVPNPQEFRAYLFHGYNDDAGAYGVHNLQLEPWGPPGARDAYNTFDLRLRYQNGTVDAWVRLHASRDWDEGGRERGTTCPRNVAVNNARPGTADSVWTGECGVLQPGETGRPVGAWVPVQGGRWSVARRPGPVQVGLSISNWQNASGPYRVSWENVVVSGHLGEPVLSSSGRGRLTPFGTGGSAIEPRGEIAEFRYAATEQQTGVRESSFVHYRSAGFELASEETHWVVIGRDVVTLAGAALVNGDRGYRYELRGAIGVGEAPDSLTLEVWRLGSWLRPYYWAFGALADGSLSVTGADEG